MERDCNYCVYHSSGSCAAWECTGTKTVDDIRADERRKFAKWLSDNKKVINPSKGYMRSDEILAEYEKEQKNNEVRT